MFVPHELIAPRTAQQPSSPTGVADLFFTYTGIATTETDLFCYEELDWALLGAEDLDAPPVVEHTPSQRVSMHINNNI
jgi:hypothetical protein